MPKKGIKVWQSEVPDNDSWKAELAKPGLLIVELFSEFFGYTEVLTPMIDDIMKRVSDPDQVRWRRVNVLKLEEELRSMEEEKNRSSRDGGGGGDEGGSAEASGEAGQVEEKETNVTERVDCLTGLRQFKGFHHPQPFFLFMRDGEILDILRSCDPPQLDKLTNLYSSDPNAKNSNLTYEIMLKTEEEVKADKEEASKKKAHMKNINTILETVDCEDPMVLIEAECLSLLKLFCLDDEWKGPEIPEDSTWQEVATSFVGKSVDAVGEYLAVIEHETIEAVKANMAKSAAEATEPTETTTEAQAEPVTSEPADGAPETQAADGAPET